MANKPVDLRVEFTSGPILVSVTIWGLTDEEKAELLATRDKFTWLHEHGWKMCEDLVSAKGGSA